MKNMEHTSDDNFSTVKYLIKISYSIKGIVSVMDIIGALFGQTEGLLNDLELRELQKSGRIGRIQVQNTSDKGISAGVILIPSSLDRVETAILAATIESVDRVGPCIAQMKLEEIQDIREDKRKQIMDRAQALLQKWEQDTPESGELGESILEKMRVGELIEYGDEKLPAGQDIDASQQIIIVEGVADVKALMRAGFRNAIATQGTHVPKTIIDLSKKKSCIAFVDGDRGGQMILDELLQVTDADFIAIAPKGMMVEELTRKEIIKHLQNKKTLQEYKAEKEQEGKEKAPIPAQNPQPQNQFQNNKTFEKRRTVKKSTGFRNKQDTRKKINLPNSFNRNQKDKRPQYDQVRPQEGQQQPHSVESIDPKIIVHMKSIIASNEALGLNDQNDQAFRVGNTQIFNTLDASENTKRLIFDGVVTQRLIEKAAEKNIAEIFAINLAKNLQIPADKKISLKLFRDYIQ
jgi:DNA primase